MAQYTPHDFFYVQVWQLESRGDADPEPALVACDGFMADGPIQAVERFERIDIQPHQTATLWQLDLGALPTITALATMQVQRGNREDAIAYSKTVIRSLS